MRIWIGTQGGLSVNFQPDNSAESAQLDQALGFYFRPKPIGNDRDLKIGHGAEVVGEIGGHETQRWIRIDLNAVLANASNETILLDE